MVSRRKRNRKKNAQHLAFPSPLAAILVTVGVMALLYLWLCGRCEALGKEITTLETVRTEAHRRCLNEQYKLSNLKSPENMERLLARHGLVMSWPKEENIVRLRRRPVERVAEQSTSMLRQYAQSAGASMND